MALLNETTTTCFACFVSASYFPGTSSSIAVGMILTKLCPTTPLKHKTCPLCLIFQADTNALVAVTVESTAGSTGVHLRGRHSYEQSKRGSRRFLQG